MGKTKIKSVILVIVLLLSGILITYVGFFYGNSLKSLSSDCAPNSWVPRYYTNWIYLIIPGIFLILSAIITSAFQYIKRINKFN